MATVVVPPALKTRLVERLHRRNAVSRAFFAREADRLARTCEEMSRRFGRGGRLLAFGRGAAATDAQHIAVEFVHPVIVGKRALPAIDLSAAFECRVAALVQPDDIVIGFGGSELDAESHRALAEARRRGALTLALPGAAADYAVAPPADDPFIAQEVIEILYHTLWESVHVFFEHRDRRHDDLGASGFLYPFLSGGGEDTAAIVDDVARSICGKANEDVRLRERVAAEQADAMALAAFAVHERLEAGGALLLFGNGGSATDANDWAIDCVSPQPVPRTVRALSLSMDPAIATALANDIGRDAIFVRQLIAYARPGDVAIAISTSGGSSNVIAALEEARRRGLLTVALLGYDGGEIVRRNLADIAVVVGSDYIPRIQEVQASIYHVLTELWRQWPA